MSQGLEQKLALCQGCKARVHHFRICLTTVRDERTETLPVSTQAAALAQARQSSRAGEGQAPRLREGPFYRARLTAPWRRRLQPSQVAAACESLTPGAAQVHSGKAGEDPEERRGWVQGLAGWIAPPHCVAHPTYVTMGVLVPPGPVEL